jgi:hypothetical protein
MHAVIYEIVVEYGHKTRASSKRDNNLRTHRNHFKDLTGSFDKMKTAT